MGLLRRRPPGPPSAAGVARFWQWWERGCLDVAAALVEDDDAAVARLLAPRVAAVHKGLLWQTGTGAPASGARHSLVVSSGGDPELRATAERWRRAGPPDDELWELLPARRPDPAAFEATLTVDDRLLPMGSTTVDARVDDQRCRVHVAVFHPGFAGLPEPARLEVARTALDWGLGEDAVEQWLGDVTTVTAPPLDAVPASVLFGAVDQLRDRWSGERWATLEGLGPKGARLVAVARHPMRRTFHPLLDEHVVVDLTFTDTTPEGLPGELAALDLRAFESGLLERLGDAAVLVGHETSGGRRLLHLYGDATRSVTPQVTALLGSYLGGTATVRGEYDPAWQATVHMRI